METVKINVKKPYNVYIGKNLIPNLPELIKESGKDVYHHHMHAFIVTDRNLCTHYLKPTEKALKKSGFKVRSAVFRHGERLKNSKNLHNLLRQLVKAGLTRDSVIIGMGGGVIGDFSGFAASVYMRGCYFVQMPTSLLAQVDSSIGGKVGINLPEGKNLAGSFYNPLLVLSDIDTLKTLPEREFICGIAEIIKYGLIIDKKLFEQLRSFFFRYGIERTKVSNFQVKRLLLEDEDFLRSIITTSVRIKGEIVASDEREHVIRMILNFGHTFGHAVETLTGYRRFLHGEAVLLGMKIAAELSSAYGKIDVEEKGEILKFLNMFEIPMVRGISAKAVFSQLERDKKKREGKINYIILEKIGHAIWESEIEKETVVRCIQKVLEDHSTK